MLSSLYVMNASTASPFCPGRFSRQVGKGMGCALAMVRWFVGDGVGRGGGGGAW